MKKISKILLLSSILSINLFSDTIFENEADSIKLYSTDLEKTILEEMVAAIIHEENIFNMFNEYVLNTGDTTIEDTNPNKISFFKWYNIINNNTNNFVKAYNHSGLINIEYDEYNYTLKIKNTFKQENNFASKRYIDELKSRSIKFKFDSNGYSEISYKLPLNTIKFLMKYEQIKTKGLILSNSKDLSTLTPSLANKANVYVPNGKGEFLLYIKNNNKLEYKGIVNTFNGVLISGQDQSGRFLTEDEINLELNKKLPRIKGSIGYVFITFNYEYKDGNGYTVTDEKSSIVEYIYNDALTDADGNKLPGKWVKRFSSVNRESIISSLLIEKEHNEIKSSSSDDIYILTSYHEYLDKEPSNLNFFEATFVGGLYNKDNTRSLTQAELNIIKNSELKEKYDENHDVYYEGKPVNDYMDNQYKIVHFKDVVDPLNNEKKIFENIFAQSYLYTNVNLLDVGGSIEKLTLGAQNNEFVKKFKTDTSACKYLGNDWEYDKQTKDCFKKRYECKDWNTSIVTIDGLKKCKDKDEEAVCKASYNRFSNVLNGWHPEVKDNKIVCSNKINSKVADDDKADWWYYVYNNYRIDNTTQKCYNHRNKDGLIIRTDGCYWNRDDIIVDREPARCEGDDIRVGGVCKDLVDGSIADAKCKTDITVQNKFADLIANYYFKNPNDKNKYIFGPLKMETNHVKIKDSDTNKEYEVCESINYFQEGYKTFYVYPSFDIGINNIDKQGKHSLIKYEIKNEKNPNIIESTFKENVYKEINIIECDYQGNNCVPIFTKDELNEAIQKGKDVKYKFGSVFKPNETLKYKSYNKSKRFEIRKDNFTNNQLLPYQTFDEIKNNLEDIKKSSNNKIIKFKALNFIINNNNNNRLKLNSGPIDINKELDN